MATGPARPSARVQPYPDRMEPIATLRRTHRVLLAALVLVASAAACGGSGGGDDTVDHGHDHGHDHGSGEHVVDGPVEVDARFEVEVVDGAVVGGVPRLEVSVGDVVEVVVSSDVADQVHLHVYDAMGEVGPDRPATLTVEAAIPGVFEAELHGSGLRVFELQVS